MRKDEPIKNVLKDFLSEQRWKGKLSEHKLQQTWAATLGSTVSRNTKKIALVDGILYVTILSAVVRQELSFNLDAMRYQLNKALGQDIIEKIVLR